MSWASTRLRREPVLPRATRTFDERLAEFEVKHGLALTSDQKLIGAKETFRQWCERLAETTTDPNTGLERKGLMVDGKPFKLDDRPAMAWIYDQIPSTYEEAFRLTIVLMKCAQVGFTVMEMLATVYLGIKFGPATVGMFLPDMNLAGIKSTERFMPIVRSIPEVHAKMTQDAADGSGRKTGEGNVTRRRIADALFVISWTSGRATTESVPMDILSFDEVQEMTLEQMEKTRERLSASKVRFTLMGSTANWPDADIDHWYKRGSQHCFHTRCPECGSSRPMDEYFPENIRFDPLIDDYRYVCENGHWIDDPQLGEWVAKHPERAERRPDEIGTKSRRNRILSIHFPQFLSPDMSPGEIIDSYNNATDMKNFFNRKLGKPYLDPTQVPVTLEDLARCVEAGKAADVRWKTRARGCFMGIDQMGNLNVHVIKERLPDGRQAVIHVEEFYGEDPFVRSTELMEAFGIAICVVEINPNYNDAKKFANAHPGRVFICDSFGNLKEDMIIWGDGPKLDVSDRRTDEEARDRYTLRMDQYKCMQVSMKRFTTKIPSCLFPDPQGLMSTVIDKKVTKNVAALPRMFHHLTKTALVAEKDEETNQYKRSVKKIGIDPHYSYANMLCDVAWARAHGTATFIIPDQPVSHDQKREKAVQMNAPGLPTDVVAMMTERPTGEVCGRCDSYPWSETPEPRGLCKARNIFVLAKDVACPFWVEVDETAPETA